MFVSVILLLCTSLLCSYTAQECSAVTHLFVSLGKDVRLKVMAPVHLDIRSELRWKFKNNGNIVRVFHDNTSSIIGNYKERVEISGDYSLLLKNMQYVDNGHYTAGILGDNDICLVEYSIRVEDPVSAPELTVESVSNSSDSCVLLLNCSTHDTHIQSILRYDTKNYSLLEGETLKVTASGASLQLHLVNGSVICKHTNQISELKDTKKIQQFCPKKSVFSISTAVVISVTVVGIFLLVISIGIFFKCRYADRRQDYINTIYDFLKSNPVQTADQNPTERASSLSPNSTLRGLYTGLDQNSTRTPNIGSPETLYSTIVRSATTNPPCD